MKAALVRHGIGGIGLILSVICLLFLVPVSAKNDCQPVTWGPGPKRDLGGAVANEPDSDDAVPQPGELNCRKRSPTYDDANYYTCTELAEKNRITIENFFWLNPGLKKDCSNIQPNSEYCVVGFIEPLRAYDGLCGPKHKNATCAGTANWCCNSDTWICGSSAEDCAPGICFEGICPGDKVWSTDGTCGAKFGNRQCAGKWGDCCSLDGKCGTGEDFCSHGKCQSGNCTDFNKPPEVVENLPWQNGNTPDGSCGGANGYTCHVMYGNCCNKDGRCGSMPADCGQECQPKFGKCKDVTSKPHPSAVPTGLAV